MDNWRTTSRQVVHLMHLCDSDSVFASSPYLRISTFPQIGMLCLASILQGANYQVAYHDRAYEPVDRQVLKSIVIRYPLFIGFYSNIALKKDVIDAIRYIRTLCDDVPVIVGGPGHFEAEDYFHAGADGVVAGEADAIIVELARRIEKEEPLQGIPGLLVPGMAAGETLAPMPMDLDALPHPAADLAPPGRFRNDLAFIQKNPWYVMLAARGCPFRCAFCSHIYPPGLRKYRIRSVASVLDEMKNLHEKFHVRHVKFQDDTFGGKGSWLSEFCREKINSGLPVQWNCSSVPTLFKTREKGIFDNMKRAGCTSLHFGLQSTIPEMLVRINRSAEEPRILQEIIPEMNRAGLYSIIDLIVGLPGETQETIQGHSRFINKLPAFMIEVFPFYSVPGTQIDNEYPNGIVNDLSKEQIHDGVRTITRRFMLRPSVIGRNILFMLRHNPGHILTLLSLAPYLLRLALGKYGMAVRGSRQSVHPDRTGDAR